jgi:predicted PurR-regulated permease PerM
MARRDSHLLLVGIFLILIFYTLYFLSAVVLPIILALVLYLLLQPGMRLLRTWRFPKIVAAFVMISLPFGAATAIGFAVSGPVVTWLAKAPETLPRLERRLSFLMRPLASLQRTSQQVEKLGDGPASGARSVTVEGPSLGASLFTGTRTLVAGALSSVVLLFFLLISGDLFLRRLVEILPNVNDKKQAIDIADGIERHVSGYLVTISLMNAIVGVATAFTAYFCGLSDPILWGTLAFLLNYVMFLGPLVCAGILFLAGLLTFDSTWQAALPAVIYLAINFVEGETLTPALLARRLTLNPVLIIVSLLFWYWMWGVAGALLAVPLLGTFKIICDRVKPLMALGHFLGTEARAAETPAPHVSPA